MTLSGSRLTRSIIKSQFVEAGNERVSDCPAEINAELKERVLRAHGYAFDLGLSRPVMDLGYVAQKS